MNKYILVAALALASTNALANNRVVSGTNGNGDTLGSSKAEACTTAKKDALGKKAYDEQVAKYSPCDCNQNEKGRWSCTVDATFQTIR
jgi:Tfp pilus assembly protein FimT